MAALLMPALDRARKNALRVSCLNDRKQNYHQVHFYAMDHDDHLPHGSKYHSCGSKLNENTRIYPLGTLCRYDEVGGATMLKNINIHSIHEPMQKWARS